MTLQHTIIISEDFSYEKLDVSGFRQICKTKETLTQAHSVEKKSIYYDGGVSCNIIIYDYNHDDNHDDHEDNFAVVMMTMVTMKMMVVVMEKVIPYIHTVHACPTNISLNLQRNPTTSGASQG